MSMMAGRKKEERTGKVEVESLEMKALSRAADPGEFLRVRRAVGPTRTCVTIVRGADLFDSVWTFSLSDLLSPSYPRPFPALIRAPPLSQTINTSAPDLHCVGNLAETI